MGNRLKHFRLICKHKRYVFNYCRLCGIPWRGLKHDLSKFSPTEFRESVKFYKGNSSPIDAAKAEQGYSLAWQHHKGRNDHHYEYWTDQYDTGVVALDMPYKPTVEMLCDMLGAGKAYERNNFSYSSELQYIESKIATNPKMHIHQQQFLLFALRILADYEKTGNAKDLLNKTFMHRIYEESKMEVNN